jgi:hypothetical protein
MFTFSTVSIIVIIAITFWACWRIPKPERWGFYSVLQLSILVALLTEVAGALATNTTARTRSVTTCVRWSSSCCCCGWWSGTGRIGEHRS